MNNFIDNYSKRIYDLVSRPTIVKCVSFNPDDIKYLLDKKVNAYARSGILFTDNSVVFNFLFSLLYIDISRILEIRPLKFLDNGELRQIIKDDSQKYNSIKNLFLVTPESGDFQYIYVKDWLKIVNSLENQGNREIFTEVIKHHSDVYFKYLDIGNEFLDVLEDNRNTDFQSKLSEVLMNKVKNNILTYVKIRNDDLRKYNKKRFKIKINQKNRQMTIDYNDKNVKYSDDELNLQPKEYNKHYAFGPFTDIFIPCLSNQEIATNMGYIINKLKSGVSVFTYGYGASGAGKTSSLVYFNKGDKFQRDGVLIYLCNMMSDKYDRVEIKIKEFLKDDIVEQPQKSGGDILIFTKRNGGFVLSQQYIHKITHNYRFNKDMITDYLSENVIFNDVDNTIIFNEGVSIGEVMIILVDLDRHVKATTNNPNSSRSHVLVYIRFKGGENDPLLIFGDFAGVENRFNCKDTDILDRFTNIKIDNGDVAFYSNFEEEGVTKVVIPRPGDLSDEDERRILNSGRMLSFDIMNFLESTYKNSEKEMVVIKNYFVAMLKKSDKAKGPLDYIEYYDLEKRFKVLYIIYNYYKSDSSKSRIKSDDIKKFETDMNDIMDEIKNIPSLTEIKKSDITTVLKVLKSKFPSDNESPGGIVKKKLSNILSVMNYIMNTNDQKRVYANDICEVRKGEGDMINSSLSDVNDVIKYILKEKNKDAIDISPEFIDKCLPSYCSREGCFIFDKITDKTDSSIIFNDIKKEFGDNWEKLIICIFCVLNISVSSNNPPPVPYIDINKNLELLNKLSKNYVLKDMQNLRDGMFNLKEYLKNYEDKIPELSKRLNDSEIFSELKRRSDEKYVKSSFEKYKISKDFSDFIEKCKLILSDIEKSNATSAIGTLHTVDNLAKYNTVNTICDASLLDENDKSAFQKGVEC